MCVALRNLGIGPSCFRSGPVVWLTSDRESVWSEHERVFCPRQRQVLCGVRRCGRCAAETELAEGKVESVESVYSAEGRLKERGGAGEAAEVRRNWGNEARLRVVLG